MECILAPAQTFRDRAPMAPLLLCGRQFMTRREASHRQLLFRRIFQFFRAVAIVTSFARIRLCWRGHANLTSPTGTRMR